MTNQLLLFIVVRLHCIVIVYRQPSGTGTKKHYLKAFNSVLQAFNFVTLDETLSSILQNASRADNERMSFVSVNIVRNPQWHECLNLNIYIPLNLIYQ